MSRPITSLSPWFGSNRTNGPLAGELLAGRRHVTVPFSGGYCELPWIKAKSVVVNDLHPHIVNLARCVADDWHRGRLIKRLAGTPISEEVLRHAQAWCLAQTFAPPGPGEERPDEAWAYYYFVATWLGRNGVAGTKWEFNAPIAVRWTASGGDGAVRFRNAARGLGAWRRPLRRCLILCRDGFEVIDAVADDEECALYCDAPFPGAGLDYAYAPSPDEERAWHEGLAKRARRFVRTRVVMRFYDHPWVAELYPEGDAWEWIRPGGKTQCGPTDAEVFIVSRPGRSAPEPEPEPVPAGSLF